MKDMAIHLLDLYRSPNIGIFIRTNDRYLLVPKGVASTKVSKLGEFLGVKPVRISVAGSRLIGPLVAMNGHGIVVSMLADDEEVEELKDMTGMPVAKLPSKYTCLGNLVVANDKGAIASKVLNRPALENLTNILNVPVEAMTIASYVQIGAMIVATNSGAIIHPAASEAEIAQVSEVLKVEVEPATVNGGIPIVSSGIAVNSKNAVVGNRTSGPELVMLSRAFKI